MVQRVWLLVCWLLVCGAEGLAASMTFKAAKEEGMHVIVLLLSHFENITQMKNDQRLCYVVARAHTKQLTEIATFSATNQDLFV